MLASQGAQCINRYRSGDESGMDTGSGELSLGSLVVLHNQPGGGRWIRAQHQLRVRSCAGSKGADSMTEEVYEQETQCVFDCLMSAGVLARQLHEAIQHAGDTPESLDDRRLTLLCAAYTRAVERLLRTVLVARGISAQM
jgi:hypothetical protein